MASIKDEIAKNILFYRRKNNLTQKELAEKLGVKHNAISAWESGTNAVDTEILFKICDIFSVTLNEMYGVKENKRNFINYSQQEKSLIEKYRSLDDFGKKSVNSIIENEFERNAHSDTVKVFKAARSEDNKEPCYVDIPKSTVEKLKNAKPTKRL